MSLCRWDLIGAFVLGFMLVLMLSLLGHGVELLITGHCAGSGILSMNYTGDALNVSILQNGTAWLINATGAT